MSKKIENNILFYVLPFLATLNIYETGALIWLAYCFFVLVFCLVNKKGIVISRIPVFDFIIYLVFSLCGVFASFMFFGLKDILKAVVPIASFLAACALFDVVDDKKKFIFRFIFAIFLAYFTQILLLYLHNFGVSRPSDRTLYSLWGNKLISVTVVAILCSFAIGYCISKLFQINKRKRNLIYLIPVAFIFLINFITSTRTPFLVFAICVFCTFFLYVLHAKKKIRNNLIISFFVIIALGLIAFFTNLFGIKTLILNSSLVKRVLEDGLQNGRGKIFINHLTSMNMSYIGGGVISKEFGFAHNIIQESYDLYGIIALVAIIVIYIGFIRTIFVGIKKKNELVFVYAPIYFAVLPQLLTEPIIEGYPLIFWNLIFINTVVNLYLKGNKNNNETSNNQ